jgi:hypothetical protein
MYPDDAGGFSLQDVPMYPFADPGPLPEDETWVYTPLDSFLADLNGDHLRDRLMYQVYSATWGTNSILTDDRGAHDTDHGGANR